MDKLTIFENLLNNPESSVLDFKKEFYDFSNVDATAKFIKDIVSFSNTIRSTTAYMVFGIKELDGTLEIVGLDKGIDDAILQNKLKDSVFPRPVFSYSPVIYKEKLYGLIEIPVHKYELPIVPSKQLKGLSVGKVYYRNGTANTEATAIDIIRINDWLKSIQGTISQNVNEEVSKLLPKVVQGEIKLSVLLAKFLNICKQNNLIELQEFIQAELSGALQSNHDKYSYRIQTVFVSFSEISATPFMNITPERLKNELLADKHTCERNFFFHFPIVEIETYLESFTSTTKNTCLTLKINSREVFDNIEERMMTMYVFENHISGVYNNIRQKFVDLLMKV
jgi:hypothetical protein